ncbi:hypothetical protein A9Q84_17990 [Halobacteriovorax marinus]|uniref:Lipoprotein n=1 Tax=Halobacteriovorax marinus TaxID=97084 RepID=A0A1Y5F3E0_9BACT|nr:hypothetical protein A9Q84_17990 [Halobacteriovorax marinus]
MKKLLLVLVTLFAAANASAESCTALLQDNDRGSNYTVQRFYNFSWDQESACRESMQECRQEMRERRRWDRFSNLTCHVEGRRGGNNGQCSYDLVNRNNRQLESFSRMSCRASADACQRELSRRHRRGQNRQARCVKRRGGGQSRNVTKSCSVDRLGRNGRFLQTHVANATGARGTGVKAQACRKAVRKCERNTVRNQYCVQR